MGWPLIIAQIVLLVIGIAMIPKPKSAPPPGINSIRVPTAEVGREIPVLFGTRKIEGPNVVWWGSLRTVAIRKKGGKK